MRATTLMHHANADLSEVHRLYGEGLYLQAYRASQEFGPLERWRGALPRVLAGRLAAVLGAARLGFAWQRKAHREQPGDPLAAYYAARALLSCRGPWAAWQAACRLDPDRFEDSTLAGDWLMFQGLLSATWRDFDRAGQFVERALKYAPDRPWIHVEHGHILEMEDRIDDALAATQRALELRPWFRPAVQSLGHLYQVLGRDEQAQAFLEEAGRKLECGDVVLQMAELQLERKDHAGALQSLEHAEVLLPLADKSRRADLAARRSEAAYRNGDEAAAIAAAEQVGHGFFQQMVAHLKVATPDDRRVVLSVPFVRQNHLTCAPATLTSISNYWKRPVDHLQLAETICYDGTPAHSERRWAEKSGFFTREFTVDWEITQALIDRGVPFTFTTVEVTTAHLQSVVGYDARRGTLLLRDPSAPRLQEMLGREGLEHYRGYGPRGMVLVPPEEESRLTGLSLPDVELYDMFYHVQQALETHDREQAQVALEQMRAQSPEHRLTLSARRMIAGYDADNAALERVSDEWSKQFPDNASLLFAKVNAMRAATPRVDRLAFLEEVSRQSGRDPVFRLCWAEELLDDARSHPLARRLLHQVLRLRPLEARCFYALANMAWAGGAFDEALDLYRAAACLDDRREHYTQHYFSAAREMGQSDTALAWLQARVRRFSKLSSDPAASLFWALSAVERTEDAFEVLEQALEQRPKDAGLSLYAADAYGRYGRADDAESWLQACRDSAHEVQWLRVAAALAGYRGELKSSLTYWEQLGEREPQSAEVAEAVARLTSQIDGRAAALSGLRSKLDAFPNNVALLRVALEWWRDEDPVETEKLVERLLAHNPAEPWTQREKAIALARQKRYDEALDEATFAIDLAPGDSWGHSVRASIAFKSGKSDEAASGYRRALELDVDNESAVHGLLETCHTHAERAEALEFFYRQLVEQTTLGDGLLSYYSRAQRVLPPATLLMHLQAGLNARPDLWHAWSAVTRQLVDMQRADEAMLLARDATKRFPLLPVAWLDLAASCQAAGESDAAIAALEKAVQINLNWPQATFRLVEARTRRGEYRQAKEVVERALTRMPLEPVLHGYLADLCWRLGLRGQTLITLRRAVELDPAYDWGWETLQTRGAESQQPDAALRAARQLVERQPGDARGWYWLARLLAAPDQLDERLAAIRRSIELRPEGVESHLLHSQILAGERRYHEALAACRPSVWGNHLPLELRTQEAAILLDQGQADEAIAQLEAVLAENPDFIGGWERLAAWCAPLEGRRDLRVEAAMTLVTLAPGEAYNWGLLGDAHLARGERDAARESFARALELAPAYNYAGIMLFDLYAEDANWLPAERTLQVLEAQDPDPFVWSRSVRLAAARGDRVRALAALEKICLAPCEGDWPLAFALDQMRQCGWRGPAEKLLKRLVGPPRQNYLLAEWVATLARLRQWRKATRVIEQMPADSFDWSQGAQRLLSLWPASKKRRAIRRFIQRNAALLRQSPDLWGVTGYAYSESGQPQLAIQWMNDWQTREGVAPWMLTNLVTALYERHRDGEAADVSRFALTLAADQTTTDHQAWLASWAVRCGEFEEARRLFEASAAEDATAFHRLLRTIIAAALAAEAYGKSEAPSGGRLYFRFRRAMGSVKLGNSVVLNRIRAECLRSVLAGCGHTRAARLPQFVLNL